LDQTPARPFSLPTIIASLVSILKISLRSITLFFSF
jgi:Ca2+/H+ antiporter